MSFVLRPASSDHFASLIAGESPEPGMVLPATALAGEGVLPMLADLADSIRPSFEPCAWMVLDGERLVGLLSLVTAPADGTIGIGYGIAPSERGRGAATGAVAALVEWASADPRVNRIEAETRTDNRPSQRALEANGFAKVGERTDEEDGAVFSWRLEC